MSAKVTKLIQNTVSCLIMREITLVYSYITWTITRMVNSEVSSQRAHFALEHTLIVVCGPIRRAHGIFEWRTSILANAPRVVGPKRLANSKVITGNIDAWIKICKQNLQEKKRNPFWLPNKWKKTRTISQPSGIYSLIEWKKILTTHHGHFQLLGLSVLFTYL